MARKIVHSNAGVVKDVGTELSSKGKDIEEGYESGDGYKSEDYHPRRTRNYPVDSVCEDNESVSYYLYHFESSIYQFKASLTSFIFSYCRQRIHPS